MLRVLLALALPSCLDGSRPADVESPSDSTDRRPPATVGWSVCGRARVPTTTRRNRASGTGDSELVGRVPCHGRTARHDPRALLWALLPACANPRWTHRGTPCDQPLGRTDRAGGHLPRVRAGPDGHPDHDSADWRWHGCRQHADGRRRQGALRRPPLDGDECLRDGLSDQFRRQCRPRRPDCPLAWRLAVDDARLLGLHARHARRLARLDPWRLSRTRARDVPTPPSASWCRLALGRAVRTDGHALLRHQHVGASSVRRARFVIGVRRLAGCALQPRHDPRTTACPRREPPLLAANPAAGNGSDDRCSRGAADRRAGAGRGLDVGGWTRERRDVYARHEPAARGCR